MKIRLLKRWRLWPIGQKMDVFDPVAKKMIYDGIAEKYDGEMSNKGKMKTDFFKPKNRRK